ncbi:hypothetical protein HZA44_01025 [Candidatus Peregrinibacteria bacterium]|nr:hypothetical protein [Candidatus Peregrinibacteria bacterium]
MLNKTLGIVIILFLLMGASISVFATEGTQPPSTDPLATSAPLAPVTKPVEITNQMISDKTQLCASMKGGKEKLACVRERNKMKINFQKQEKAKRLKAKREALSKPHFGDGNYIVGTDIQPGTYRTRKASAGCYYSRLSGFGGSMDEIISNDITDFPAIITIAATDKGFKSTRCGTWTQDLSAITTDQTKFGDGIFIVNTDIQPGTYKSTGGTSCYYSRLKGFTGSLSDIISNEITDFSAVVTIDSADKGFKSLRCGAWTKLK